MIPAPIARGLLSLVLLAFAGPARAAEPKNYAYLFLQGKVSNPSGSRPGLEGARVHVVGADSRSFEALTDPEGVFRFERLPVQRYTLTVTAADGQVIQSFDEMDGGDPARHRLEVRMGTPPGRSAELTPAGPERLDVTFSERTTDWKRFWTQFGIFLGAAVVLAL